MKTITYMQAINIAQKEALEDALDYISVVQTDNGLKLAIRGAWSNGLTFNKESFEADHPGIKVRG